MEHRRLGQYVLEELLGAGGMGEVYRAHDTVRDRRVALKVLPEAFSHDGEYSSRFRREQHIAARLRDPHIIPIHDFGEIDGRLFIDMRLVDGRDVSHLIADGALSPERAVHLIDQAAQALDSAHAEGLVHRDVKPSNLLATPSGFVYVVDFGIARKVGTTRTSLTVTGATVGTLDYMAPERFTTAPLDARADIYSLACLLYECLTGQRPFPGHDLPSLMYAHFYTEPERPSLAVASLPEALDEVVLRGMAKNPDDRFASAGELAAAAHEALGGRALLAPSWTTPRTAGPRGAAVPPTAGASAPDGDDDATAPVRPPATAGPAVPAAAAAAGAGGAAAAAARHRQATRATEPSGPADPADPAEPGGTDLDGATVVGQGAGRGAAQDADLDADTVAVIDLRDTPSPEARRGVPTPGGVGLVVAGGAHRTIDPLPTVARRSTAAKRLDDTGGADPRRPEPPRALRETQHGSPSEQATQWAAAPAPVAPDRRQDQPGWQGQPGGQNGPSGPSGAGGGRGPGHGGSGHGFGAAYAPGQGGPSGYGSPPAQHGPAGPTPPAGSLHGPGTQRRRRRGAVLLGVLAGVVVLALVATGAWLHLGPRGGATTADAADTDTVSSSPSASTAEPEVSPTATTVAASVAIPAIGPTVPVGSTPGFIEVTPNGRFAYIANRDAGVVTVLDTTVNQVTATIPIDAGPPQFLSFSPSGRTAYISVYRKEGDTYVDNNVVFLDTATNKVTNVVPVGTRPFASATNPDGSILYVPSHDDGRVDVIDTATGDILAEKTVAPNPHWVAFAQDGSHFYTANHESNVVSVIDADTLSVTKEIAVGKSPHSTAVSPDGSRVSVVCYDSDEVWVIDTATEEVVATIPVDARPQDIAYAPDGRYMYTANVEANTVDVIDTATNTVTASIPVGGNPTSVSVLPNGTQAYVTLLDQGLVRILDVGQ